METDARCATCREAGIECPRGYDNTIATCNVCGRRHVVTFAACNENYYLAACPTCGGSTDQQIDGDDDGN